MSKPRKSGPGRPPILRQAYRASYVGDRKDRDAIRQLQRRALQAGLKAPSESSLVRQGIRHLVADPARMDLVTQQLEHEARQQDLLRQLEHARERERRAEAKAEAALKRAGRQDSVIANLLRHLPSVRDRVQNGPNVELGIPLLDQMWHNAGRNWKRVLARLEEVERQRQAHPDGGGT